MAPKQYAYEMIKEDGQETKYMICSFKNIKERDNWIRDKYEHRFSFNALSPMLYLVRKYKLKDYTIIPRSLLTYDGVL